MLLRRCVVVLASASTSTPSLALFLANSRAVEEIARSRRVSAGSLRAGRVVPAGELAAAGAAQRPV
jgi:hypothetical protein